MVFDGNEIGIKIDDVVYKVTCRQPLTLEIRNKQMNERSRSFLIHESQLYMRMDG